MIVRCHHLREAGILTHECCSHCHIHAGFECWSLLNGHEAHICCAWRGPFTQEEVEVVLEWIPRWEQQEAPLSFSEPEISLAFRPAYQAIQRLESNERYRAALILGSVAQGEATEYSTMEVWIIVADKFAPALHPHWNQKHFEGIRLKVAFFSWDQFHDAVYKSIENRSRSEPVFIARSLIIFDKTGHLQRMRAEARYMMPSELSPFEQQALYARLCDWRTLVQRKREEDQLQSAYWMRESLSAVLVGYYRLRRRWWPGGRQVLRDVRHWDQTFAQLVEHFLSAKSLDEQFQRWWAISEYILRLLNDQPAAAARICSCERCINNYSFLPFQ